MKGIAVACLIIVSMCVYGQTKTGRSTATGECAVSHSGNNDVITIQNCGIGKEQADKIVAMLKAVLANQKEDSRDAKLDELLELARRAANPYGTTTTYQPDGIKRTFTPSTNTTTVDDSAKKDLLVMLDQGKTGDWAGVVTFAKAAIEKYPGWFTPFLFLGEAQFHLCLAKEAAESLTKFVNDTEGAVAYEEFREIGMNLLNQVNSEDYKKQCAAMPQGASR